MSKAAPLPSHLTIFAGASLAILSGTMVGSSLPSIGCSLALDHADLASIMEAYLVPVGLLLPVAGGLDDRFGRSNMFIAGVALLVLASTVCALALDLTALLFGRLLQGMATAAILPNASALLGTVAARRPILAAYSAICTAVTSLGPAIGGLMSGCGRWRIAFLTLAAAATVTRVAVRARTAQVEPSHERRIDSGIDPTFRRGPTMLLTLYAFALYGSYFDLLVTVPAHLMRDRGFGAAGAGAGMLPVSLVAIITGPPFMRLVGRWRPASALALAAAMALAAVLGFEAAPADGSYVTSTLLPVIVLGLGMALASAPMTIAVLDAAGTRRAGMAAGLNNARLGGAAALGCQSHLPCGLGPVHPNMVTCIFHLGIALLASITLAAAPFPHRFSILSDRKVIA